MRYWGKNIQIDGSFYDTAQGRTLLSTPAELALLKAAGNYFQFEGNADFYEATVQNMMRDIQGNPLGRILINAIIRSNNTLRIIPLTLKEQVLLGRSPCANPVGGTYKPAGVDCVIWFEPWSRMLNHFSGMGISPYQMLVHELQHALRQMRGKLFVSGPVGFGAFPNVEELFSTTIENIYLSLAGQPQRMLGSYSQVHPLGSRSDSDWFKQYGNELSVWSNDLPDVSRLVEGLYCWNPFRVRRQVLDHVIAL